MANYIPKVSVITITFNSENTLERAIKTIIDQRYENLEYIIVDGGSKDGTLDIITNILIIFQSGFLSRIKV